MTELDDATGVHISRCHADGFVVIADESEKLITGVLQFCEKLHECLVILAQSQHANRNVMREVVDAVDEGNLPIITFHRHELSVHDEEATEAFGITVRECDLIVVRKRIKLCDNPVVSSIRSFADPCSECPGARTFQVQ